MQLSPALQEEPAPAVPEPQVFKRGKFMFNRRFFETKFSGFFGVVRRDAERDMLLIIKTSRDAYTVQRISRISTNDMHLEVHRADGTHEVTMPFTDVQEIVLKHKDAA